MRSLQFLATRNSKLARDTLSKTLLLCGICESEHLHCCQPGVKRHFEPHQYNKSGTKPTKLFRQGILPILPLRSLGSELASEVPVSEILDQVSCSQNLSVWGHRHRHFLGISFTKICINEVGTVFRI